MNTIGIVRAKKQKFRILKKKRENTKRYTVHRVQKIVRDGTRTLKY